MTEETTARFKTLRHIETVRNMLNTVIVELMHRQEQHDQSKLQDPEVTGFDTYTPLLRDLTYGSDEYFHVLKEMKPFLDHHYANNRHHPEFHANGIDDMTLVDLVEMLCDWKAATLRHNDGNINKSILINSERFEMSSQLTKIFYNTVTWLNDQNTFHHAEES